MASKVVEICEQKINPIIENLGYEVVEVEYAKKVDGMNLTFYIDNENGILIEDCEKVNNAITDVLDEINITNDVPYILNVSSPGLDRPIKNYKDFLKNKDKMVELTLYKQKNGQKKYCGKLVDFSDANVVLNIEDKDLVFERAEVANICPVIEF